MKKIVASVGLVALSASGIQAAILPSLTDEAGKPWTVSATLRGFYDDNFNSAADDADLGDYERDTFGFEVAPSIRFAFPLDQTTISLGYTYSFKYYDNKLVGTDEHTDSSHTFDMALDHAFSERYSIDVRDSFVIGQEPDLLRTGNAMTTFQRVPGDNIRNFGSINFNGQATPLFGYQLGYANSYFNYDDEDPMVDGFGNVYPSLSGLLNRLEHVAKLDTRWNFQPTTAGVLGYQYREIDYTGDEAIAGPFPPTPGFNSYSDDRNSRSHYMYVGADHAFRPDLSGSIRAGAQYTDYFNDDSTDSSWSPYALLNLRYTYLPESFVELGATHDRNATDVAFWGDNDNITLDQESTVVYLAVTHRIMSKLYGGLLGQYQHSTFNGGAYDDDSEDYIMAGVNLEYRFNQYFSAHAGYNYDQLVSDVEDGFGNDIRDLHRNRVYLGVTARY
jgi:hypothetical protein